MTTYKKLLTTSVLLGTIGAATLGVVGTAQAATSGGGSVPDKSTSSTLPDKGETGATVTQPKGSETTVDNSQLNTKQLSDGSTVVSADPIGDEKIEIPADRESKSSETGR